MQKTNLWLQGVRGGGINWETGSDMYRLCCAQSCPTLCDPMDCSLPGSSVLGILQTRILEWVAMPSSRGSNPNPGIKPMSPALQVDSLLFEPPEKPKNTGVGSLSLLQGIFLTQESNWGLLHCRQILYQLSYQGSAIPLLDKYPRELKMYVHTKTHMNIHSHIIYHSQKVRLTQMPIN